MIARCIIDFDKFSTRVSSMRVVQTRLLMKILYLISGLGVAFVSSPSKKYYWNWY